MKKFITLMSAAAVTIAAGAGDLDLGSQARLRAMRSGLEVEAKAPKNGEIKVKKRSGAAAEHCGFVSLAPGTPTEALEAIDGVTVEARRGDIALVRFTEESIDRLASSREVRQLSLERPVSAKLDIARKVSGIDKIHNGEGLPRAYTGKGVAAGIVDGGFDFNHLNFKNEDGSSRLQSVALYTLNQAGNNYVETRYDNSEIAKLTTDDATTFHGTHTMGIMAGGYKGKLKAGIINGNTGGILNTDNPYYGAATGADIVAAAGALTDYNIALGVESMLDYAYSTQKPLVVNLSLGSNVGPHDGTSMICQYIDAVIADKQVNTLFCISAGNEGDMPIALNHTFAADGETLKSFIRADYSTDKYQHIRYGQNYFYSIDDTPFEIQAVIYNTRRDVVAMRMPLEIDPTATESAKYWVSSTEYAGEDGDIVSPQFARYFEGYVGVGATYDNASGRFYAVLDLFCWDNTTGSNANGDYLIGFEITGKKGQKLNGYSDGNFNYFSDYDIEGYADGMFDGTINDIATGKNPIVVGAYSTRDSWLSLDGGVYGYRNTFTPGKLSAFSSFGNLIDGRALPTVCAPGATIISSSNEYYLDGQNLGNDNRQAAVSDDARQYSWHQCVGTSMSSPLVAGSLALWLEADPTLTCEEARDIIVKTAVRDADVTSETNQTAWGAGKFDAYAGLREVLAKASVTGIGADSDTPVVSHKGGNVYTILLPGATATDISVTDLSGRTVVSQSTPGEEAELNLDGTTPGVYIVKAGNTRAFKIAVK